MGKYIELRNHLLARKCDHWNAAFSQIEDVLKFKLPASARKYPAWWANQNAKSHVQCLGWLDAGWRTSELDQIAEKVTFLRSNSAQTEITLDNFKPTKPSLTWNDVLIHDHSQPLTELRIGFLWQPLGELFIDQKGRIAFPRTPFGPAVYRFEIVQNGGVEYYVGETDEISRRLQHYRTPGATQQTNQRLNRLMCACLENGGTIHVAIATRVRMYCGGTKSNPDFADKHQRRLIENAAIVAARNAGHDVLNK